MQTFLPFSSFQQCAQSLDNKRLGKQRVECKQILKALTLPSYGWKNHPAVKMWKGYEYALCVYAMQMCHEWRRRGFKDSLLPYFLDQSNIYFEDYPFSPKWIKDGRVHRSHQSNLIRKLPEYYSSKFPDVPDNLPYYWPNLKDYK